MGKNNLLVKNVRKAYKIYTYYFLGERSLAEVSSAGSRRLLLITYYLSSRGHRGC